MDGSQDTAAPASTQPSSMATDSSANTGTAASAPASVDYEKRYLDTQAAYTRSQQELSSMRSELSSTLQYLQEMNPYLETVKQQQEFYQQKYNGQQKPASDYDYPDGVDGALRERDTIISQLQQEMENLKNSVVPEVQRAKTYQTQQEFKSNQYRLYQEFGANEFGSAEAFGEFLKAMPQFVPNWEAQYMSQPGYDTLKQAYLTMRGAIEYQKDSPLKQQIEAKKQQDFLKKQANYLGGGVVQYGPSPTNPNQPYMSPLQPF